MSRRFWILTALCAGLTIGTFTPEQTQAGWRRRCCGRVYGCGWRGGWGGWYGGYGGCGFGGCGFGGCGFGGYGFSGYGFGRYGVCSTGFGGNYTAGAGASYGVPYLSTNSMPYYASTETANPYVSNGNNIILVTSASSTDTASMTAGQGISAPIYPGDPIVISRPTLSFLARHTAVVRKTSSDQIKGATSFVARHSPVRTNTVEPNESIQSVPPKGYGYGYGMASSSGYSYKANVVNAPKDVSDYGLSSIAMNR